MELTTLEKRILLKCNEALLNRTHFSQLYKKYTSKERMAAIDNLITQRLILAKEMPKVGANKVPIFYEVTDKGKDWVKNYKKSYPK